MWPSGAKKTREASPDGSHNETESRRTDSCSLVSEETSEADVGSYESPSMSSQSTATLSDGAEGKRRHWCEVFCKKDGKQEPKRVCKM